MWRKFPSVYMCTLLVFCGTLFQNISCRPKKHNSDIAEATLCQREAFQIDLFNCIESSHAPSVCLSKMQNKFSKCEMVDLDKDSLDDTYEEAIAKAYSPIFAFNKESSDGFSTRGEFLWPVNTRDFITNSKLVYRTSYLDENNIISDSLLPEDLAKLHYQTVSNDKVFPTKTIFDAQSDPNASCFWLCLKDRTDATIGKSDNQPFIPKNGIDISYIVRPLSGKKDIIFLTTFLFYGYNDHSYADVHEGDWEGMGIFIDAITGQVIAGYFDRHPTVDDEKLIQINNNSYRSIEINSNAEPFKIAHKQDMSNIHGMRFYDSNKKHHPVLYVGTGGHAGYDYPGYTNIFYQLGYQGVKDDHNGLGYLLIPWKNIYQKSFTEKEKISVKINYLNFGSPEYPLSPIAAYLGQWGCSDKERLIGNSWPHLFGNWLHPRPWVLQSWENL